ncbi:MAG TPA: hypothetical protein VF788_08750, partial [Pseudonocardiaceae bacterium]
DYQGQISPSSIYNADNHLTGTFFNPTIAHHPKPAPTSYPWPGRSSTPQGEDHRPGRHNSPW